MENYLEIENEYKLIKNKLNPAENCPSWIVPVSLFFFFSPVYVHSLMYAGVEIGALIYGLAIVGFFVGAIVIVASMMNRAVDNDEVSSKKLEIIEDTKYFKEHLRKTLGDSSTVKFVHVNKAFVIFEKEYRDLKSKIDGARKMKRLKAERIKKAKFISDIKN